MTEPADKSAPTAMPILIAVAVTGAVLIGAVALRACSGGRVDAEAGVGMAVVGQNDALQRDSYPDFLRYTCAELRGTEAAVLAQQRRSKEAKGARFVDDVTGLAVDGDRATASVTYHFEKSPDDKVTSMMSFVREQNSWKVCSAGPR